MSTRSERWSRYYAATEGQPPRQTLLSALAAFEAEGMCAGIAVDLGAGTGRDSLELLRRGWKVLAIDGEQEALASLRRNAPTTGLETSPLLFEELKELPTCHLVNASFSLPFCAEPTFLKLWHLIYTALKPGGRFAGQLLGAEDSWAGDAGVTAFSKDGLFPLLEGYTIEKLQEEKTSGLTPKGRAKYWHLYHLVLHKQQMPAARGPVTAIISNK